MSENVPGRWKYKCNDFMSNYDLDSVGISQNST